MPRSYYLVVEYFRDVGVEVNAIFPGQACRLAHEVKRYREGRARGHDHANHRSRLRIMDGLDGLLCVGQDVVLGLDNRVGWQPAVALAKRHRTAGQVHPERNTLGGLDLVGER